MAKSVTDKTAPKEWKGAFDAYSTALNRLTANHKPALFILGVALAFSVIDLAMFDNEYGDQNFRLSDLFYFVFLLAMPTYALALADKKQITTGEVMRFDLRKYATLFVLIILTILIVAASFVALIFPVIWTLAWFYFGTYAAVDKPLGPIEALKESKRLASQHKGKVWGIIGVSILISIGASVLARIPLLGDVAIAAASLWAAATAALLYRWLQKQPHEA